jgi:hypothetical protein
MKAYSQHLVEILRMILKGKNTYCLESKHIAEISQYKHMNETNTSLRGLMSNKLLTCSQFQNKTEHVTGIILEMLYTYLKQHFFVSRIRYS